MSCRPRGGAALDLELVEWLQVPEERGRSGVQYVQMKALQNVSQQVDYLLNTIRDFDEDMHAQRISAAKDCLIAVHSMWNEMSDCSRQRIPVLDVILYMDIQMARHDGASAMDDAMTHRYRRSVEEDLQSAAQESE